MARRRLQTHGSGPNDVPTTQNIDDQVTALRAKGSERVHDLANGHTTALVIGSASTCDIVLAGSQRIAPKHAMLYREGLRWTIRALTFQHLVLRDGAPLETFPLSPGIEIGIGEATFIAESARLHRLHQFLHRLLGFGPAYRAEVDHALRIVRRAATGEQMLLLSALSGDDDLVAVARQLHERTLGAAPFVVCGPRRGRRDGRVRASVTQPDALLALAAAAGGTLCIRYEALPSRVAEMMARRRASTTRVQVILCAREVSDDMRLVEPLELALAPIKSRPRDLMRIIDEYAMDASAMLGVDANLLTTADRYSLSKYETTLSGIEQATVRLLAIRQHGGVNITAQQLGLSHAAISRWLGRRSLEGSLTRKRRRRTRARARKTH